MHHPLAHWFVSSAVGVSDQSGPDEPPTIEQKTVNMERNEGYFPFYWDARWGKIWLEIDK